MKTLPNVADFPKSKPKIELRMPPEIQTSSGFYFNFLHPEESPFTIEDIAFALSKLCRFTGHVRSFYSVAQHSVAVSKLVPPEDALAGLLHDASEAFMGDINSPLKQLLPDYRKIERTVEAAILGRFGLPTILAKSVKVADLIMLATEKRDLMPGQIDEHWDIVRGVEPISDIIYPLDWRMAYFSFLDRYREIMRPSYLYLDSAHPSYVGE